MERKVFTVTELNGRIKGLFELDPMLSDLCVRGELSNYKIYPSGHHYFTLKDSESSLRCVMFKSSAMKLRFRPENGMSVSVFGRVSVYPRDGAYQLYCEAMIPEGTGDLQIAFEQLKAKLDAEGLFAREHKKPLPRFPKRVAVITSSAGAAVHDMIRIMGQRWPMAQIVLLPVRVQGGEAPPEIVGAIRYANEFNVADVIITGRGGGSIEDLWAFNDERVARAIYDSRLPVISAVGHEPDVTISDYVADARASTPSNAAEIVVPDRNDISDALESLEGRMSQAMRKKLQRLGDKLDAIKGKRALSDAGMYVDNKRIELDRTREKLISAQERINADKQRRFTSAAAALDAMSPLRVIARGYSLTTGDNGKLIKSVDEVSRGQRISVRLRDGSIDADVADINKKQ